MQFTRIVPVIGLAVFISYAAREPQADPRMKGAFRKPAENGWTYVHLEGTPAISSSRRLYDSAYRSDDAALGCPHPLATSARLDSPRSATRAASRFRRLTVAPVSSDSLPITPLDFRQKKKKE